MGVGQLGAFPAGLWNPCKLFNTAGGRSLVVSLELGVRPDFINYTSPNAIVARLALLDLQPLAPARKKT